MSDQHQDGREHGTRREIMGSASARLGGVMPVEKRSPYLRQALDSIDEGEQHRRSGL